MSEGKLIGKSVLCVIAKNGFRDEQLFEPIRILKRNGANVTLASTAKGLCRGMLGGTAEATCTIHDVNINDYHAIVFVGGAGAVDYFDNPAAHNIVKHAADTGKVVAAICTAPSILANAAVLDGKHATSWPSRQSHLKEKGAILGPGPVVTDGNIITAVGPQAAKEFAQAIVDALAPQS